MNCLECQAWLQRRLDGEPLAPTETHEQHWSQCAVCREQYQAALRLLEGMKQLPRPKPAPGFAQDLGAKVMQDRRQRVEKMRRRVYLTMALAASVALLMIAGYWWIPHTNPDDSKTIAKVPEKKIEPAPQKGPLEPKLPQKQEPKHAFAALTERWADTTRDHAKVVMVATNLDAVDRLPINELPAFDPGVREAGQEVSDGVRAVTRSARRALDFFARELPMPDIAGN